MIQADLKTTLTTFAQNPSTRMTVLTGAGVSAESGIPTFRGLEGYWTLGSKEYQPQEIGAWHMFEKEPDAVWLWYLYRRGVCHQAAPNAGHTALVALEQHLGDRFTLITQNVDGLHLRAGNSLARTFQIHGNIDYMRCLNEACSQPISPIPDRVPAKSRDSILTDTDRQALRCPYCQTPTRPHVLWFDETYNEEYYRFHSSIETAKQTDLLIVVGTSGATTLPHHVVNIVIERRKTVIDINPNENIFAEMALHFGGYAISQPSGEVLPEIVGVLCHVSQDGI